MQNVVTYTVVLATENARSRLLPGMTTTVRITVEEAGPTLKLPMAALRFSPSVEHVQAAAAANGGRADRIETRLASRTVGPPNTA